MPETPITLKPAPRTKVPVRPKPVLKGWVSEYLPGKGGDANLLIMFHGLGDTRRPFAQLAQQMQLPFTAVLSLQAPEAVPFMGESYMWYTGFDGAFNPLSPANAEPRAVVPKLRALLADLSKTWALEDIHLFGFGQGASAALALALSVASNPVNDARRLGSAVAVLGGLEGSTRKSEAHSNTPVLYYTRRAPDTEEKLVKDRFAEVTVFRAPAAGAMPANMDEWRPVMGFWGKVLKRDDSWKGGEVYEVVR